MTEPTQQDIDNAARRTEIAAKFRRDYEEARALAEQVFGPGWEPTGKHMLISKAEEDRCRRSGGRPVPAVTVITLKNAAGEKRHFRSDGAPTPCESMEAGFGEMLLEPDPDKTIEWDGKTVHLHKYSLCWAGYEPDYRPQTAEQLAAARSKRQEKAVEREAQNAPLFADQIRGVCLWFLALLHAAAQIASHSGVSLSAINSTSGPT